MNQFAHLTWYRLRFSIINTRLAHSTKAHAVSVVDAIIKSASARMIPPLVEELSGKLFFHITDRKFTYKLHQTAKLDVELIAVRLDEGFLAKWRDALQEYLSSPEGEENFSLVRLGEVEAQTYDALISSFPNQKTSGEICLEFFTPVPFKPEKSKRRTILSRTAFVNLFEKRFSKLFGEEFAYKSGSDDFSVLPYYWSYAEIKHLSHSQSGTTQYINGCAGKLYIKGSFADFLPFLILGSELHAGLKLSNSQGYYKLHFQSPGYFCAYFPNKQALAALTRDVLQRYDHAAESLVAEAGLQFDENSFAEQLVEELKGGTYTPSPNTAFMVKKKSGGERMVEQPAYRDLIVEEYVLKTFSDTAERIFEEESIGFRRGVSRQKAVEMVRASLADGYRYVIESDIEDFFPSVDLHVLERLLDSYIPVQDALLKSLLVRSARTGYLLNGRFQERVRGLAQGSPLSPLLANLYLDSFDEAVKSWGVRLVRYADDFIILTKTIDEAENILSKTEACLSHLGLKLKKERTCIKPMQEGFQFLGIRFNDSEVQVLPEEELKLLKKPLYVTEPYTFLAVNGDALEVKKGKEVLETIPLRRVSEIMVMEKTVFSTGLITKCTEHNIPFTITLNSGYYVTTVMPDSKKYFDISYEHAKKYYSLGETALLSIAKEFAAGKLKNYIALFKQRYRVDMHHFVHELEEFVARIYAAATVHEVRGLEGAAAKKIYPELNALINDRKFHLARRDRKEPDRINSLLNFAYYLLYSRLNVTVRAVGLNPYLGFLHSAEDTYESLVADLVELFRARIDRFIVRILNLKVIQPADFVQHGKGYYLTRDASKKFLNSLEGEMEKKNSDERLSLKETIYVQVRVIRAWAVDNGSLSFYTWEV
ncbi:MAG: CRISPR-associated endonuclease Cas1 [Candidatus Eisenbacteria bacterium]|nr:CRISPR-associated endonuclease Cas1 [Candidatus Eisenbacteria bacterium]